MNILKTIHTDILMIMIEDVNQRARAGDLSDSEYALQIAPLNSELYQRAVNLFNEAIARQQSEFLDIKAVNRIKQIYASFFEYKKSMDRVIKDYVDFLADKQLDEAFKDWHNERIQKQMDAAAGKEE